MVSNCARPLLQRAMDEYTSEIFMGGRNTIVMHNTCEDSLLAAPIILDLCLLTELLTRIEIRKNGEPDFHALHPVASLLSYLTKASAAPGAHRTGSRTRLGLALQSKPLWSPAQAPLVPKGTPIINALAKQRNMLENFMRACVGLAPENNMMLEFKDGISA